MPFRCHRNPGIANRQPHDPRQNPVLKLCVRLSRWQEIGFDGDHSAPGHRFGSVENQIEQDTFEIDGARTHAQHPAQRADL